MNQEPRKSTASLALGLFLIALAAAALYFSQDLARHSAVSKGDPGPRFFPFVLSLFLLAGGLVELGRALVQMITTGFAAAWREKWFAIGKALRRRSSQQAGLMAIVLGASISGINVLGFSLAMFLFAVFAMSLLGFSAVAAWMHAGKVPLAGSLAWWRALGATAGGAAIISGVTVIAISLIFVHLLKVQLPGGMLGLPF